MKKLLIPAILFIIVSMCAARAEQSWETPCLSAPYTWSYRDDTRCIEINKYCSNNVVWFTADIQLSDISGFHTVYNTESRKALTRLVENTGAVFAVNGDDFTTHEYGIIIRNGQLLRSTETTRELLVVDSEGCMRGISGISADNIDTITAELTASAAPQVFAFGPVLIEDGQAVDFPKSFDVISVNKNRKEPRTAIGMISPLHYVIIVVDGRQPGYSEGISLQDLQALFQYYGVQFAFNLDGGGSTELWFDGEIINRPSGGSERNISDIIAF